MTLQVQIAGPSDLSLQKRNIELKNKKVRKICSDYRNELEYPWNSDPDRKGKDVYDFGEVYEMNKQWEREAIRRDVKGKSLFRVLTGKPVYWSDSEGKRFCQYETCFRES